MAKAETISRLHRTEEQVTQFAKLPQPENARVKTANFADSQIAVSALPPERQVRGRFVLRRAEPEPGYTLTPEIMSTMVESTGPRDYARGFQELAERERLEEMLDRLAARRMMAAMR
jgi:hypothetical protein